MARIIIILSLFLILPICAYADNVGQDLSTFISSQNIKFEDCTKVFNIDNVTLFYQTIAAINANRFTIDEIQSKSGYILFTAVNKKFLATITNVNTNQAMLKITPANNNYYFQPGIISNIHKYIDLNKSKKVTNINFN